MKTESFDGKIATTLSLLAMTVIFQNVVELPNDPIFSAFCRELKRL